MPERDEETTIESLTDYEIPHASVYDLDAHPAFEGEGWVEAEQIFGPIEGGMVYRAELDNGVRIELGVHFEQNYPLTDLPEHNSHHIQQRGDVGNSGFGNTYIAGDFYIDHRKTDRRCDGRQ